MTLLRRMAAREADGAIARVAITGAGFIGRGLIDQIALTPGMETALIITRRPEVAARAFVAGGRDPASIAVTAGAAELRHAVRAGRLAVTDRLDALAEVPELDVLVEATGAVSFGARAAARAIDAGLHVVMMNAETDGTVGPALARRAAAAGVVYTNADGDQPGVLMRLVEFVTGAGLDIVAAVNCKGFMDVQATPESVRPWAERQGTSLAMTTAFADGTKMNLENAVLANATGLVPEVRGMHGVETTLATALRDCLAVFGRAGLVDYTLGGDFGGGVFVIGRADDPDRLAAYMDYFKMGPGPEYLFHRPYHLCHLETPRSIAEAILDGTPTIAPRGAPVATVVAVAKRDLAPGEILEGLGGRTTYGVIDVAERAGDRLVVGLAEGAVVTRPIRAGETIAADAVERRDDDLLATLDREQRGEPGGGRAAA